MRLESTKPYALPARSELHSELHSGVSPSAYGQIEEWHSIAIASLRLVSQPICGAEVVVGGQESHDGSLIVEILSAATGKSMTWSYSQGFTSVILIRNPHRVVSSVCAEQTEASLQRFFYADSIEKFLAADDNLILGELAAKNPFPLESTQRDAWHQQIQILKIALRQVPQANRDAAAGSSFGKIYFEYSIPRLGRRADVILLLGAIVFVIEFKVGEKSYPNQAIDQVWDYALDLKNFHETSHHCVIAPILLATKAPAQPILLAESAHEDRVLRPIHCNSMTLSTAINEALKTYNETALNPERWQSGRYSPTPTIIEAATALYRDHSVAEISRSDAGARNLTITSERVDAVIAWAKNAKQKAICFVTGVPGAGKTLVGLNVATQQTSQNQQTVFLSGNGPLVAVLREALTRDRVQRELEQGRRLTKTSAMRPIKLFIQNVHHFRDECLIDPDHPPVEHVAIFDEAQRAWNQTQTANFMLRKKQRPGFLQSEPEFLISCLDRHPDWAVVVCLVGGGQEINTGEAGISEWIESVVRSFPDWHLFVSSQLHDSEYGAGAAIELAKTHTHCQFKDELHLAVSMRSFRAENVSNFVKNVLDFEVESARHAMGQFQQTFPLVMTRNLHEAKQWLKSKARGSERFGVLASSQAHRLKPHAIDVRVVVDPIHWFLAPKADVRSSYYLEDVATEFQVQGLELDWACVTWDADFRRTKSGWEHFSFVGDRWNRILKSERREYLKNAYRVLLTRARQGMVIVVPEGVADDPTRASEFYDQTFAYLQDVGIPVLCSENSRSR